MTTIPEDQSANERERLIEGLREAVDTLYRCRYSELPLAKKLDDLLKEITGKSRQDITWDLITAIHPTIRSKDPA